MTLCLDLTVTILGTNLYMNTYFKNVLIICYFKVRIRIMFLLDFVEKIFIYEHSNEIYWAVLPCRVVSVSCCVWTIVTLDSVGQVLQIKGRYHHISWHINSVLLLLVWVFYKRYASLRGLARKPVVDGPWE